MPAAPLPEIKESDAHGDIADLYDDVRAVIGVPIVNLIFRHMATVPGCLEWAWSTIRPIYISGDVPAAADALTANILPGQVADLRDAVTEANLTRDDIRAITRVLDSYGRANPMNAVGLQIIDLALKQAEQNSAVGTSGLLKKRDLLRPQGLVDLLPMADPATAPDRVTAALKRLARQIHGSDTGVIPSLYRHFGGWPVFLESLEEALAPALAGGIEDSAQTMLAGSRAQAQTLYKTLPLPDSDLTDEAAGALNRLVEQFPANICRMTVLATLLKRGLPQ